MSTENQLTRRQMLTRLGAAAGLGALTQNASADTPKLNELAYRLVVPEIFVPSPTPPSYTRNLVIGSGFGGAITALRLSEAGESVTVLERGFKWPNSPTRDIFSNDTLPDGRAFWFKNKVSMLSGLTAYMPSFGGVMDVTEYPNMTVWRGAAVGGGSIIFTGVMIQPEQRYFDAIFGGQVSYAEMNNIYYPKVRRMLNLSSMPADVYNSNGFAHSRVWDAHMRKAGYTPSPIDSLFNWSVLRDEIAGRSRKSATVGLSNHGNSNGAKFDLNQNYLKQAQATGRTTIYSGQEVQRIGWDGSRYVVEVITRAPTGAVLAKHQISCDRLFLAAGSVGTSELLVKAQAENTLRNLNEAVGAGWGTNGDALVVRSFAKLTPFSTQGAASASRIHDTSTGVPLTLENWYVPGVAGVDLGISGSLGMFFDQTNRGRFQYNGSTGAVNLNWAANGNAEGFAALDAVNRRIASATGTLPGAWPFRASVNGMNWTAHPLGGAVLGQATDNHGRVKGHPGLYVMDGALIPGTTGAVNPSLTISALAERNIENILRSGA